VLGMGRRETERHRHGTALSLDLRRSVPALSAQFSCVVSQVAFFVLRLEAIRRQGRASVFPSVVALFRNGPSRQAQAGAGLPEIPG
jgi:hypothetical protein